MAKIGRAVRAVANRRTTQAADRPGKLTPAGQNAARNVRAMRPGSAQPRGRRGARY